MYDTKILEAGSENLQYAREKILQGEVVGIPTETVYGLAANAFDEKAVGKIFTAKGRPQDNPLIVHICDMDMLKEVAGEVPETAYKLAKAFWGGPLTMILPKSSRIPRTVSAGLDTVGVRMPSHPVALSLIRTCGVPLAAPSANVSGKPSPTRASHVFHDLKGKIDCILDGGECEVGLESTVVKVLTDKVEILRPGKITIDDLLKVVAVVQIDDGVFTQVGEHEQVSSPGMKYKHYSPNANVVMVEGKLTDFCKYVLKNADEKTGVLVFDGEESLFDIPCITYGSREDCDQQAAKLFDALRELDQYGLTTVFARVPSKDGVGLAVYNRLLRACGFEVANLKKSTIIGLTGQTGSGKTTVSEAFVSEGMAVIDCDEISREVISKPSVMEKLTEYFGTQILTQDQTLNRQKLASLVFTDEENLIFLNSVMYPHIFSQINTEIDMLKKQGHKMIVLDAPTLFESKANRICDCIVSILAPLELRTQRIIERDHITLIEAQNRIHSQHEDAFYSSKSDFVLYNDSGLAQLKQQAKKVIDAIKEKVNGTQN